jgi:hypothetical protein
MPRPNPTQQAPMGSSPVTGPTANKGYEAAAVQGVSMCLMKLTQLASTIPATSDLGKAINDAIRTLAKAVPPGGVSQEGQRNEIDKMAMQNAQQMQDMKSLRGGGQGQGQPQQAMAA